jgi:hypothetical protein
METSIGGEIQGISLSSLLQMIQTDKQSCTLQVTLRERTGYLVLFDGTPIAAGTGDLCGNQAAYEILAWDNPTIRFVENKDKIKPDITEPLMNLMLDSQRIKDESEARFRAATIKIAKKAYIDIKTIEGKTIRQELDRLDVPKTSALRTVIAQVVRDAMDPEALLDSVGSQHFRICKPEDRLLLDKMRRETPIPFLKYVIMLLWIKVTDYKKF